MERLTRVDNNITKLVSEKIEASEEDKMFKKEKKKIDQEIQSIITEMNDLEKMHWVTGCIYRMSVIKCKVC